MSDPRPALDPRSLADVGFRLWGCDYRAVLYGPEYDGALDVAVVQVGARGAFRHVGMGVWARRFVPLADARMRQELVRAVDAALREERDP